MSLQEHHAKEKALHSVAAMTSAQIVNASNMQHKTLPSFGLPASNYGGAGGFWQAGLQVGMSQE